MTHNYADSFFFSVVRYKIVFSLLFTEYKKNYFASLRLIYVKEKKSISYSVKVYRQKSDYVKKSITNIKNTF